MTLRVGLIADEFTTETLRRSATIVPLDGEHFEDQLRGQNLDLVLVESAWKGNGGQWLVQLPAEPLTQTDKVTDLGNDEVVAGLMAEMTELREALARAEAEAQAARDIAGNRVSIRWTFHTRPVATSSAVAPVATTPVTGPAAPADLQEYGLWLINQSRAQYGFAPLRLDAGVSGADLPGAATAGRLRRGAVRRSGRRGLAGRGGEYAAAARLRPPGPAGHPGPVAPGTSGR